MLKAGYHYQPGDQIVTPGVVYRVEKELGKGGVGCTYKAINKSLNAPCVVKVMLPAAAADRVACERFQREAQMSAQIGAHPNLVRVVHRGHLEDRVGEKGTPFLVMDWIHGLTVRQLESQVLPANDKRFSLDLAITIAADVLQGLAFMHHRGVVHRDIKPENVLVTKSEANVATAKVIDLGAACLLEDPGQPEYILTPRYAAPEQFAPGRLGPAVDVFATAVMLFEMITGKHPYSEFSSTLEGVSKRLSVPPPLLSVHGDYPEELTLCLLDAMALRPDQRSSVTTFLSVLEEVGNRLASSARSHEATTRPDLLPPGSERHLPITRADLAAATEPGAPPEMDDFADTGQPQGRFVKTALMPRSFVGLVVERPRPPTVHQLPTGTFEPDIVARRPRNGLLDGTVSLDFNEVLPLLERGRSPGSPAQMQPGFSLAVARSTLPLSSPASVALPGGTHHRRGERWWWAVAAVLVMSVGVLAVFVIRRHS